MYKPDFSPIDVQASVLTVPDRMDPTKSVTRYIPAFADTSAPPAPQARIDLQTMTIPLANDRSTVLNQSVGNEFRVVQASNDKVGALNNAMQEIQRIAPTGVGDNKQANTDIPGYKFPDNTTISAQTLRTLNSTVDAAGQPVWKLFKFKPDPPDVNGAGPFTIEKMQDGKTFSQVTTIMKSAVDQASQNNQLEMTTLQGLTNKYNQSIETMSDLVSKFADLNGKLVGNFHPLK